MELAFLRLISRPNALRLFYIDRETLIIGLNKIEDAITSKTFTILATHVYGIPCDIDAIKIIADARGLEVLYDKEIFPRLYFIQGRRIMVKPQLLKNPPIIIIGHPRSGTSLLRSVLNAHSKIVIAPECGFAQWLYDRYNDWSFASNTENKINGFVADVMGSRKFETWGLKAVELTDHIKHILPNNYAELVEVVYFLYAKKHSDEATIWGDKNNYYIGHLPLIYRIFPKAKYIFIVRDGRDVACSLMKLGRMEIQSEYRPKKPTDIAEIAQKWNELNLEAQAFFEKEEDRSLFYNIRYEDFVQNTQEVSKGLCSFLGIEFEQSMLEHEKNQKALEPKEFDDWKHKVKQPIDTKAINQFQSKLTEKEILTFNNTAKEALEIFGYQMSVVS